MIFSDYQEVMGGIIIIEKLALGLTNQMIQERLINREHRDDYIYAMVTSIEKVISISTIFIMSILAGKFIPSLCFLICFYELRKRTGGHHAQSFLICYIETIVTYIAILYINSFLINQPLIMHCMLVISCCILIGFGTVNHPNLHMDRKELTAAKKSARILLIMETGVILFFEVMKMDVVIISYMVTAITVCAVSMCMAKMLGQEVKIYEENQ